MVVRFFPLFWTQSASAFAWAVATRRFGAFAVLTLCAIEKIRAGRMTASEAARQFEQVAHAHGLRETGHYDPKLVDMLIVRLRQTRKEEGRTWGEERQSDFASLRTGRNLR
jgi:hypothetical protein